MERNLPETRSLPVILLLLLATACGGGSGDPATPAAGAAADAPRIDAVSPLSSRVDGGGTAVITGARFQEGVRVHFGGEESPRVERLSTARLEVEIPAADRPGEVVLQVLNPDGGRASLTSTFLYTPFAPPRVTAVDPARGNHRRPLPVKVKGQGFRAGATLHFGSEMIAGAKVAEPGLIEAELPPLPVGTYTVKVINPDSQEGSLPAGYESALVRDTPIRGVRYGRLADLYDLEYELTPGVLVPPGIAGQPGKWRLLDPDPVTGRARLQLEALRESQPWSVLRQELEAGLADLPLHGWGGTGSAPVLPRDAALRVEFTGDLGITPRFWRDHPGSVSVYRINGDPNASPGTSLQEIPCQCEGDGRQLQLWFTSPGNLLGLPPGGATDRATVRIAFPLEGAASVPTLLPGTGAGLTGKNGQGLDSAVIDLRAGRAGESGPHLAGGLLVRSRGPRIVGRLPLRLTALAGDRVTLVKEDRDHAVEPGETILQDLPDGRVAAGLVRTSDDAPGRREARVVLAGEAPFVTGPALLFCPYRPNTDRGLLFLRADPPRTAAGVDPLAGFQVEFSEPVRGHRPVQGWLISGEREGEAAFDPKQGGLRLAPPTLQGTGLEASGAFARLRLTPPLGLFHRRSRAEEWTLHLSAEGARGIENLSGLPLEQARFAATFHLDPGRGDNPAAYLVRRFTAADEDGTRPEAQAPDWWGDAELAGGRLLARPPQRFQARTDPALLAGLGRGGPPRCTLPHPLYTTPDHDHLGKGGLLEPFHPGGSRLQATWREDDLGLSRHDPADMHLEVTGAALAPFDPANLTVESLDSLTLYLSHAGRRPDLRVRAQAGTGRCEPDPAGRDSGLETSFAANPLGPRVRVLDQVSWTLDPRNLVQGSGGRLWLPLPPFQGRFVWRDLLLPRLGGRAPGGGPTADLPSPWGGLCDGTRPADHPPPALPLLLDFLVQPDDPGRGGLFTGANRFRTAYIGPPWPLAGHGLYAPKPALRAHTTAGPDRRKDPPVFPTLERHARGGYAVNGFLGTLREPARTPPTDDHLPWLRLDLLRRVTVVTGGFIDLTRPERNELGSGEEEVVRFPPGHRPAHFHFQLSPEPAELPAGTRLTLQWRGARELPNPFPWDPLDDDEPATRGNLLNPHYACDADRLRQRGTLPVELGDWQDDLSTLVGGGEPPPRFLVWRVIMESAPGATPARPWVDTLILGWTMRP